MSISHVATPTNGSGMVIFSILIHKSIENNMGQTILFVERSGSTICLIW